MIEKWDKRTRQRYELWMRGCPELEPIDPATCGGVRSLHSRLPMYELHCIVPRIIPIDAPPPQQRDSDDPHQCNVLISRHNLTPCNHYHSFASRRPPRRRRGRGLIRKHSKSRPRRTRVSRQRLRRYFLPSSFSLLGMETKE